MPSQFSNINELWGFLVVEELVRTGVTCFCISSGSRSTPLTIAAANNKSVKSVVHFDERGAGFYALGNARATGTPAAVICTSGTAVANLMPAVIEASIDHVPMIILSADRPPELRQSGANQTIDQVKIFGEYARWQMDMPCPDEKILPEFVLTSIDQAIYQTHRPPGGPVHLNFMFREPLAPEKSRKNFSKYLHNVSGWLKSNSPYTSYQESRFKISEESLKSITKVVNKSKSGIIVCGKLRNQQSSLVLKLADKIGWPVFPDIASGLRLRVKSPRIISCFDQMLLSESILKFNPETVLHFGSQLVSKRFLQYLEKARPQNYLRITNNPQRLDPNHQVTLQAESDIAKFCEKLIKGVLKKPSNSMLRVLKKKSAKVEKVLLESLENKKSNSELPSEPAVARIISQKIYKSGALFLASSMPVRDTDMFASDAGNSVPVEYNRGASGIDGTIASAVGYANGKMRTVTLLIGDLAFLHDLNSLSLVKKSKCPIIIVVLNNDGGGIFSFLPVVQIGKNFEEYFGTPHGLNFQKSAEQFGIRYHNPKTLNEFTKTYLDSQKKNRACIIEINTDRKTNRELHRNISIAIKSALDSD